MGVIIFRDDGASDAAAEAAASEFKLYHYDPTTVGAMVFLILFLLTSLFHVWQLIRSRAWFVIPLVMGGFFEVVGYGARFKSGQETAPDWSLGPYIMQAMLLLVAPALFAATIYMELGRIILLVDGESRCFIPRKWMTKIFVAGDVLSFFLQGGGGGYQASGSLDAMDTGANIIIAGLIVQLLIFGIFMVTSVAFNIAIHRLPTAACIEDKTWKKHMLALYTSSLLIMIRSLFRLVEYVQGFDGYLLSHEIYLYVLDAALMLIVMLLFNWYHPGEITTLLKGKQNGDRMKRDFGDIPLNPGRFEQLRS